MKNSELLKLALDKGLRIGNFDIETSPDLSWHYGNREVNIDPIFTEVHCQITSIAVKDLSTGEVTVKGWEIPKGKYGFLKPDKDKLLLKRIVPLLRSYDILIGQNHQQFDVRKINWRLNELGMSPLNNLILIDTMIESRKAYYAPSHRLNFKSARYGLGGKIKQDMDDCVAVAKGDVGAHIERMVYNSKDTDDDNFVFWKEVDGYRLSKGLILMLKLFIKTEKPTFCIKCASRREARFDIKKSKTADGYRLTCNRCEYMWRVET